MYDSSWIRLLCFWKCVKSTTGSRCWRKNILKLDSHQPAFFVWLWRTHHILHGFGKSRTINYFNMETIIAIWNVINCVIIVVIHCVTDNDLFNKRRQQRCAIGPRPSLKSKMLDEHFELIMKNIMYKKLNLKYQEKWSHNLTAKTVFNGIRCTSL